MRRGAVPAVVSTAAFSAAILSIATEDPMQTSDTAVTAGPDRLLNQNRELIGLLINNGGVLGFGEWMVAAAWHDVGASSATLDMIPDGPEQTLEFEPYTRQAAGSEGTAEPPAATGSQGSSGLGTTG